MVTEQSPRQGITGIAEYLAAQGRNGDTNLTHTTTGETIIPEEILAKNPGLRKDLQLAFENEDIPMDQYVVGSGIMSVNPETGLYEAGWLKKTWKSVRKTVKKAGPIIGATVGFMIGGPVGASIGAGIGTKTSAMPKENILRNMAIAYGGSAALQGAGMGGAVSAAQNQGIGAFFNTANWTPMAGGQTGITGFFQNLGSGAGRSFGLGNTASFSSAGLNGTQITALEAEMAAKGVNAATAATNLGMDAKIIADLSSGASFGPGAIRSFGSSYSALNPLEQWAVKTVGDVAIGLPQQTEGEMSGQGNAPAYMTRPLSSGARIQNSPVEGSGQNSGVLSLPGSSSSTMTSSGGQQPVNQYASALDRINRGNELLETRGINSNLSNESLAAPGLMSLNTPFPTFAPQVYAQQGGFGQDLVRQQQPHSHPELHSHAKFQQMNQGGRFVGDTRQMFAGGGVHMGGGQVSGPGGEKEDLINAKLSNNEFVMTADAVRGAGNGNINRGADQMYKMMNKFEGMA